MVVHHRRCSFLELANDLEGHTAQIRKTGGADEADEVGDTTQHQSIPVARSKVYIDGSGDDPGASQIACSSRKESDGTQAQQFRASPKQRGQSEEGMTHII